MDVTSLHEALLINLLQRVEASGAQGIQLIDLMCEREGLIRVGDQLLLSSVAARIEHDKGNTARAVEILDNLAEEAHILNSVQAKLVADRAEKRNKRMERMGMRINPSLPPQSIVKPSYTRIVKHATGGIKLVDTSSIDALLEQNNRTAMQVAQTISRLYQSPFVANFPKIVLDSLELQRRLEPSILKSFHGLASLELMQSDYTPAIYEDVPERVEQHPFWLAFNKISILAQKTPVSIWQSTESERNYRNPSEESAISHSPKAWLDRQRKAYDRALEALVKSESVKCEGKRKQKRYFSI